jgi:hypothetical protein
MASRKKKAERPVTQEERIEAMLASIVIDDEVKTSQQNARTQRIMFEDMIDMLECKRTKKEYKWMSDIFIPEYASQVLTRSAADGAQYFADRDFVKSYLQDDTPEAKLKEAASERLINRTLNRQDLFYYPKFMRSRLLNDMAGNIYARCWWEREDVDVVVRHEPRAMPMEEDIYGNPVSMENEHLRRFEMQMKPVYGRKPLIDQFNFDLLDGRNVFKPVGYFYSVQQMPWITVRFEKTYSELMAGQDKMGYQNLDRVRDMNPPTETEASKASANDTGEFNPPARTPEKPFDVYERHGTFWCAVEGKDEYGDPSKVKPGIDDKGVKLDDAVLLETISTFVVSGGRRVCIRFQLQPYKDPQGRRYKPILRGICFIHPTKDDGLGDGTFSAELQVAVNDTYNMGMDREKLSMIPTLLTRRDASGENPTIYIAPGHPIELEDPKQDLDTLRVDSKLDQTFAGVGFLQTTMQRINATGPTQYGETPRMASTSATAVAGAESHSNVRNNSRQFTFEYTFLCELYRMIMNMTWQYASYETGQKLLGELIKDFDITQEYLFKPVSQAIETEYSKDSKIKHLDNMLAKVVNIPNPKTAGLVNAIIMAEAKLMGDEYAGIFKAAMLDPTVPVTAPNSPPKAGNATAGAATNQSGMPVQPAEAGARMAVQQ